MFACLACKIRKIRFGIGIGFVQFGELESLGCFDELHNVDPLGVMFEEQTVLFEDVCNVPAKMPSIFQISGAVVFDDDHHALHRFLYEVPPGISPVTGRRCVDCATTKG
jgi:hypothetical protein